MQLLIANQKHTCVTEKLQIIRHPVKDAFLIPFSSAAVQKMQPEMRTPVGLYGRALNAS